MIQQKSKVTREIDLGWLNGQPCRSRKGPKMITERKDLTVKLTKNEWSYITESLQLVATKRFEENLDPVGRLFSIRLLEIKDLVESQIKNK